MKEKVGQVNKEIAIECLKSMLKWSDRIGSDEIAEIELTEGSGVFTNVIAQSIVKGIRKVGKDITRQRNVDKKISLLSQQLTMLGGLTLLVLAVSGDKKGTLSKGMSLISIVKSMKKG